MLTRFIFNSRNKWCYIGVAILVIFCIFIYIIPSGNGKVKNYEVDIFDLFNREPNQLANLNITCRDSPLDKYNCYSLSTSRLANRFPRILIIGFGKAGTRALLNFLHLHPSITGPPVEVNYFDKYYDKESLQSYLETFPPINENISNIEKSPSYIISPGTPYRLSSVISALDIPKESIKLIVLMRDPLERAVSEYLEWVIQRTREFQSLSSFDEMVFNSETLPKFITTSEYDIHVSSWLKYFPLEQFCFVDGDLFIEDPFPVLQELEICLGIKAHYKRTDFVFDHGKGFFCVNDENSIQCLGKSKGRIHPEIEEETRKYLRKHFKSHNLRLEKLIHKEFTWARKDKNILKRFLSKVF
ncbi:Heparan sulfate glucosamine 3-O-sulfotransferase 1-like [Oopsacas minuta]|uniref:Heparan sulfate glucosamine 3-O-sulfotransferase 1-like n=1 Tax=Oopsacas minuta TaxID=111878 RepID=A0AAV7KGN4_9METZ|nr:Heparan sulfate glucosamine 3-O-sulfotransferase 1-like [Oopsacas minuta]